MLQIEIPRDQIKRLEQAIAGTKKKLPKELAIAVNATAKKTKGAISKEIRNELATKKTAVDKTLKIKTKATASSLSSTVRVEETRRIPLRDFGARQTKRGVSYKISKTTGRKTVLGAFQGPKPGVMKASWKGNVFKRAGKARLPIVKLMGVSPWGVFVKKGLTQPSIAEATAELKKQIERRIRFINLKKSGDI